MIFPSSSFQKYRMRKAQIPSPKSQAFLKRKHSHEFSSGLQHFAKQGLQPNCKALAVCLEWLQVSKLYETKCSQDLSKSLAVEPDRYAKILGAVLAINKKVVMI
ncbi:hypothetical protein LV84_00339 [Algoriphagus ratkowskyi]|uniref:Uncharacterized protein n=1 Tax=Algoriphagus ratkowskyi TaxID=57028 RepID=A0A2W7RM60_9BACT|nr:hypothetical protein [Algoriphagus ratkowskyi]PZX61351.1 hypothetical protein LV84_00339 [Algoriphagus ratkowskyi]TXD79447.1 hypothetical protein ESW18_04275 [Algoriphagus ratkowskyi]